MTRQHYEGQAVLFGAAFALGLATGLLLQGPAKRLYERARLARWHREYEGTVAYDQNLPEQLERREPAPRPDQPRFGGTGALGVSPERAV